MNRPAAYKYLLLIATAVICLTAQQVYADQEKTMSGISIIGSNESPKALFIVPWKDAEPPLTAEQPSNSLLNDRPRPLDPQEFRRFLHYYAQVHDIKSRTGATSTHNN